MQVTTCKSMGEPEAYKNMNFIKNITQKSKPMFSLLSTSFLIENPFWANRQALKFIEVKKCLKKIKINKVRILHQAKIRDKMIP